VFFYRTYGGEFKSLVWALTPRLISHNWTFFPHLETSRLNLDLDYMLQWPLRNVFSTNATKSQAMVVNPRLLQLDDACQISLDGDIIDFHQKV
jgi:hypothetical protein